MSDNGEEDEHSDVDDYYEGFAHRDNDGENADDGDTLARVIVQLRTNDPSLFSGATLKNQNLVIRPSISHPGRVELAEALTQNTVVRRITLQPHDYKKYLPTPWPSLYYRVSACCMWT
jgi:hypothetical protein